MTTFIQLHALTMYPPSNVNRDDLGRPKTATVGGTTRTRISSQSLKRAWRTSTPFNALAGHLGKRTKRMGTEIANALMEAGLKRADAKEAASAIAEKFGKLKTNDNEEGKIIVENETLIHIGPAEEKVIFDLVAKIANEDHKVEIGDQVFLEKNGAVDIAMFGRMLASSPRYNTDASIQVAHAITTHTTKLEDDFFTAVDDLNDGMDDAGAGHMGEHEFTSGVFYQYICINRDLLKQNLDGNEELTKKALAALIEAVATVSPSGKQNSFAALARCEYMLVEVGPQQPRTLANAFLKSVSYRGEGLMGNSIEKLEEQKGKFETCYGKAGESEFVMNVDKNDKEKSLAKLIEFVLSTQ